MSQWKADDSAANTPNWVGSLVKVTPNTYNQANLFGNTTADAYVTGQTVGIFGVSEDEVGYITYKLIGAITGSNVGTGYILTTNATTQLVVNAATDAVVNIDSLVIGTVGINAAGQGYVTGDIVQIDGGDGTEATVIVTANNTGNVTALVIQNPGYYDNVAPGAVSNTTAVTGSGNSLVVDLTMGVGKLSVVTAGVFEIKTTDDYVAEMDADQTGTGVKLNLTFAQLTGHTANPGFVLRTVGSGGRAGRVQEEVLVAICNLTGDAENTAFPNA